MEAFEITLFLLTLSYILFFLFYLYGWLKLANHHINNINPSTKISIIIPVRNEEKNIASVLRALQQQSYPQNLIQVIVANDQSTDNTAAIARR